MGSIDRQTKLERQLEVVVINRGQYGRSSAIAPQKDNEKIARTERRVIEI